jgi:hypothetical protein
MSAVENPGNSYGQNHRQPLAAMASPPVGTFQHRRLVDELMVAYVEWREESARVSDAYGGWATAEATDGGLAFGAYVAALDREERASQVYAGLSQRVGVSDARARG